MHIKRKTMGKFWPVARTGTKYMAVPTHEARSSLPLILVMRDLLKVVKSKKELKKLLNEKQILINNKVIRETNYPLMLYDSLSLPAAKKNYKVILDNKRFNVKEATDSEIKTKTYRVINKRLLPGKKIQINLNGGKNIITNEKIETGEFVIVDNATNKITKTVALKKDVEVIVIAGKHIGKIGKIKELVDQGNVKVAQIKTKEEEISANINNIFAKE
jgi:small subunit ribosomal protein S4e